MNHLLPAFLKRLEEKKYFGTITLKFQDGKIVHANMDQVLKEQEIVSLIK